MNQFQSFGEVLSALRRRFSLILFVIAVGCVISVAVALAQDKVYEATAVVQIEDGKVPDTMTGNTTQNEDSARQVKLIEQRMMSRDNLVAMMEKYDLFQNPQLSLNQRVFMMRKAISIDEITANPNTWQAVPEAPSGLIITVTLGDAQKAADLANEVMDTIIAESRARTIDRVRDTLSFFEDESTRVEAQIQEMENRVAAFKTENSEALPGGIDTLRNQLGNLKDTQLELDREIVALEANSSRQREAVMGRQLGLMKEQKALIVSRIASIEDTLRRAPEVERTLNGLELELTQLQDQYSVVTRRKADAEMGQQLEDRQQMVRFEVLETALVPQIPATQSRKKLAIMGGVASVFVGLMVGFVIELMNPVIRTSAQLERALGVQPVISIPVIESRGQRRRRRTGLFGGILALFAGIFLAIWGLLQFFGERLPLIDRLMPRAAQP